MYDFSIEYSAIDKSDILNIHKYLMVKNNIKQCLGLLNKYLLYYWVLATTCVSLDFEACMIRPCKITFNDLNPTELNYYLFMISLDTCSGSY